jgi:hypothetical protein
MFTAVPVVDGRDYPISSIFDNSGSDKLSRDTHGGSLGDNTSRQGWRINSRILLVAMILFYFVLAYSSSYDKVVLTRATHKTHTHARYDLS